MKSLTKKIAHHSRFSTHRRLPRSTGCLSGAGHLRSNSGADNYRKQNSEDLFYGLLR